MRPLYFAPGQMSASVDDAILGARSLTQGTANNAVGPLKKLVGLLILLSPASAGAFSVPPVVEMPGVPHVGPQVAQFFVPPVAQYPHSQAARLPPLTMAQGDDLKSTLEQGMMQWMNNLKERKEANLRRPAEQRMGVRSPTLPATLKWMGKKQYLAIAISLPEFGRANLDFVLDTGANTNTIDKEVSARFGFPCVGCLQGGIGAGGGMGDAQTVRLGEVELADVPKEKRAVFMQGLTATEFPVQIAAKVDGLLGHPFLNAFPGGVEFLWEGDPTINFHMQEATAAPVREKLIKSEIKQLPRSGLPIVMLNVNGVLVPALFDTGSPITVLNEAAAKAVGLTYEDPQVAPNEDKLYVAGNAIVRTVKTEIKLGAASFGNECRPWVGYIPGFAMLTDLGGIKGPVAILGLDVMVLLPRMWYTRTAVYFPLRAGL